MIEINNYADFIKIIQEHDECLVKIGTSCCGPCKIVQKNIEDIEKWHSDVCFISVDAENADEIVEKFNIRNVPVVLVIKKGTVVSKTVGLQTQDQLEERL